MNVLGNAIEISGVTRSYGALKALDGVSLEVDRGELFGLIGPDGAGKTTLYRILATLLEPDAGSVRVCGLDAVADYKALRRRIGYMPERFSLYPDLSVRENLNFFASLFGVSVAANYDLIAPIFGQLERFPDRPACKLSGGMKQKLALSCALIHRPEILLLDEPTTGVDAVSRSEFWDMLAGLRDLGITIMVSTSYMDEANRCDRVAMMNGGRILQVDTPAALVSGVGANLYEASGPDMFALLAALRGLAQVVDCYTFGASLHVVTAAGFNAAEAVRGLAAKGLPGVSIAPARGTIEDLFIKLTRQCEDGNGN